MHDDGQQRGGVIRPSPRFAWLLAGAAMLATAVLILAGRAPAAADPLPVDPVAAATSPSGPTSPTNPTTTDPTSTITAAPTTTDPLDGTLAPAAAATVDLLRAWLPLFPVPDVVLPDPSNQAAGRGPRSYPAGDRSSSCRSCRPAPNGDRGGDGSGTRRRGSAYRGSGTWSWSSPWSSERPGGPGLSFVDASPNGVPYPGAPAESTSSRSGPGAVRRESGRPAALATAAAGRATVDRPSIGLRPTHPGSPPGPTAPLPVPPCPAVPGSATAIGSAASSPPGSPFARPAAGADTFTPRRSTAPTDDVARRAATEARATNGSRGPPDQRAC